MKKPLVVGAALLLCATAYSATLLTDDMNYGASAGDLVTVSGGAWVVHSGTTAVGYVPAGLSFPGYAFGGVGGAATIAAAGSQDVNRGIGGAQAGDVYVSALVSFSAAQVSGTYFLHLKDSGTTNFRARVFAQDSGSGALRFGLGNTSTATMSTTDFAYGTTYLVVVRYNGTTGATDLHVLTSVPATEPVPLISITDGATLATMEALAIRQGSGGPTGTIDGIYVGTTWGETVPVELMGFSAE